MGSSRSQTLGRCPGVRPSRGGTNLGHRFHAHRCGVDAGDSEYLTRGDYLRPVESAGSGQIDLRIGALGCQSSVLPFKALSCNTYRVYKERQSRQRRRGTESPLAGWYKAGHPDRCLEPCTRFLMNQQGRNGIKGTRCSHCRQRPAVVRSP